jgi:hypothetical protein
MPPQGHVSQYRLRAAINIRVGWGMIASIVIDRLELSWPRKMNACSPAKCQRRKEFSHGSLIEEQG